jgi:hypothetical protein
VAGIDDTPLQAALERLAEADILLVQGLPPEAEYRFKHALIQDAAYENLLKSRRQVLHCRVAHHAVPDHERECRSLFFGEPVNIKETPGEGSLDGPPCLRWSHDVRVMPFD